VSVLAFTPLAVQGSAMMIDEVVFHRRRGLPRFERLGHPLDTLTVAACYAWLLLARPTRGHAYVYLALGIASCLFVTKDEPLHARACTPGEQWVHSILFLVHPVALFAAYEAWSVERSTALPIAGLALSGAFAVWQLLYWNTSWNERRLAR
jgi:hypothetical protein